MEIKLLTNRGITTAMPTRGIWIAVPNTYKLPEGMEATDNLVLKIENELDDSWKTVYLGEGNIQELLEKAKLRIEEENG